MNPSYNNSFGSANSGGGDVILSSPTGNEKKGSKKFIIIILALLVIVGAGVGVGVMMMNKPKSGGGNTNVTDIDIYALRENYYNDSYDEWVNYYNGEKKRLTVLHDKVASTELKELLKEQQQLLEMFNSEREQDVFFSIDAVLEAEVNGNFDSMVLSAKSEVANLEIDDGYVEQYVSKMSEVIELATRIVGLYSGSGCVIDTMEALRQCELSDQYLMEYINTSNSLDTVINEIEYNTSSAITYYEKASRIIMGYKESQNA